MKPLADPLANLLALRRHERLDEGYWQDFLCEFHQTQREQAVKQFRLAGFLRRVLVWFPDLGSFKWAYGVGLGYALVAAVMLLVPRVEEKENTLVSPVSYQVIPAAAAPAVEQLDQLDSDPSTQGSSGEQVF